MAIELSIQPDGLGPEAARTVPVATHAIFRNDWAPASQALRLEWIPLFETGIPVATQEIPLVLAELRGLADWVVEHRPDSASRIMDRVQGLISELEKAQPLPDLKLYIG